MSKTQLRAVATDIFKASDNLDVAVNGMLRFLDQPENTALADEMFADVKRVHVRMFMNQIGQQLRKGTLVAQTISPEEIVEDTIRTSTLPTPKSKAGGFIQPNQRGSALILQQVIEDNLLNFTLPIQGQPLMRNATRDDLWQASEKCRKTAKANAVNARWFSAVREATPEDKTVGEVLSHDQLKMMRMNAELYAAA